MTSNLPKRQIAGVLCNPLRPFADGRGWLCELFRHDELDAEIHPAMAYISETSPGVVRGPHEHLDQTDCFCFLGSFQVDLWDNRPQAATFGSHEIITLDPGQWLQVIIPPRVVHAYKNTGSAPALVVNFPNRLYKGRERREPVDEIRHEDDPGSPFQVG
jgi:dTDP-4-dehydrorhamnose 3,5-epimerase